MTFNSKIFSTSTPLSFLDFVYKKVENGVEPIYPSLKIIDNNNEKVLYLDELVSFNNNKVILNDEQGITYNILTNNVNKTIINVSCDDNSYSLVLEDTKAKKHFKDNVLNYSVSLNTKISSYNCEFDLDSPGTIDILSKMTNNYIKNNIQKLINLSKENNIDFLGIGLYAHKHNKKDLDFRSIEENINVNTTISSIGEIR